MDTIAAFGEQLRRAPSSMPAMLAALLLAMSKRRQIVIAGRPGEERRETLARVAREMITAETVLLYADGGEGHEWLAQRLDFIRTVRGDEAVGYVCEAFVCQLPVRDEGELRGALR